MTNTSFPSPGIALIGCGQWGKNLARNFAELGALRLICDQDTQRAQEFAQRFGVEVATEEEIFSHPHIEAVVIATSAPLHTLQAAKALEAGKHVYLEKPMALSLAEAQSLSALAKQRGKILMVGHILNYHPAIVALKERLRDLGTLKHIYANRLSLGRFRAHEGILWDLASHDVSLILSLTQRMPEIVQAVGHAYLTPRKPAAAFLNMTFSEGLTAHIHTSWISPFKEQKFVVIGEKGMAVFDDQKPWDQKLTISTDCVVWQDGHPVANTNPATVHIPLGEAEPLKNECVHFLACVRENKTPLTCGEEGTRVTEVLERAEQVMT